MSPRGPFTVARAADVWPPSRLGTERQKRQRGQRARRPAGGPESPRLVAHEARPFGCPAVRPGRVEWREGAVTGSRETWRHPLPSSSVRHVAWPVVQRRGGSGLRDKVGPCEGRTTVRGVRGCRGGENQRQQLYLRLVCERLRRISEIQLLSPIFGRTCSAHRQAQWGHFGDTEKSTRRNPYSSCNAHPR